MGKFLSLFSLLCLIQGISSMSNVYMDYHCGGVVNVYYKGLTFFKLTTSNYYRDNMNCKVTLEVLAGYRMMFHFTDFRTESCCDHLELHDGNLTSSANITGLGEVLSGIVSTNQTYTTTGNAMTLRFESDGSAHDTGFEMVITPYHTGSCSGYEHTCPNGWCISLDSFRESSDACGIWQTTSNSMFPFTTTSSPLSVRLVGGTGSWSGRVEVYYHGEWGTVCDDYFDRHDARVVCRMLGYYRYTNPLVHGSAYYGQGRGRIALDNLDCTGYESSIEYCNSNGWWQHNCNHNEDVGVNCLSPGYEATTIDYEETTETESVRVRLTGGTSYWNGRVEVYYHGQWGTVCDDNFDSDDAYVVCKMIGYAAYRYPLVHGSAYYGQGSGNIIVDELRCSGYESSIENCRSNTWFSHDCSHSEDVGVDCYRNSPGYEATTVKYEETTETESVRVRLTGGTAHWNGRVEVYYHGQWGTVCDDNFDSDDAYVVCKMIGYGLYRYPFVHGSAYYGQGSGQIIVDELRCSGYESSIENCRSNPWFTHDCSHSEDVGVDCYRNSPMFTTQGPWTTRLLTLFYTTKSYLRLEDAIHVSCNEYGWDIKVDMNMMRILYPHIKTSDIYLGKNLCTGIDYGSTLLFHQGLRECLTTETISGEQIIYRNELVYAIHNPNNPFIIQSYNWTVEVECDVERNQTITGHLHHSFSSGTSHHVSGGSNYSVNLGFYQDPNFRVPVSGNPLTVKVGTPVYVKVFTVASSWSVKMVVHDCYTKPSPGSPDSMRYDIIRNGCEVDANTHIIAQSTHETKFVFTDFEFTTNHEGIYLFCDATFCGSSDYSVNCQQRCH